MGRGPDNIIAEYLVKFGHVRGNSLAKLVAEEIEEALEAEDYMPVHRDCTLMFAPTFALELALSGRKDRSDRRTVQEVIEHWHGKATSG